MKLQEIMTRDIEVVEQDTSLHEAAEKMKDINVGPMPVVDQGRPVGILTDRDIVIRAVSEGKNLDETKVGEIMTPQPVTCREDADVEDAVEIMEEKQIRRVLVVDKKGGLVGIVSLGDVATQTGDIALAGTALEEISETLPFKGGRNLTGEIEAETLTENKESGEATEESDEEKEGKE